MERDLQQAVSLHRAGDLAGAIRAYRMLLKQAPRNAIVHNLYGLAEFQAGQLEAAAEALSKAFRLQPDIPDIDYNLATVLQRLGRNDEAIPHFEKVLAAKPQDADARNNFAMALKAAGRVDEAIGEYRKVLAAVPNHAAAHLNLGNTLAAKEREADALPHLEKSIALHPGNPEAHISLGNVLRTLKREQDSLVHFDRAIALNPHVAEAYACKGLALVALKRFDEGAGYFLRATQMRPDFAEAFLELGQTLFRMDKLEEALPYFEQAIKLKPDSPEAYYYLGGTLALLDRHDESFSPLKKAVDLKPDYAEALSSLAGYYFQIQNYAEASALMERSRAIDPSLAQTHLLSANIHAVFDRDQAALADLQKVLVSGEMEQLEKSWSLGTLWMSLGDWDRGWELYEHRFLKIKNGPAYRHYSAPLWDGGKVRGNLVAWGEQGLGDHILYASMVPELQRFADKLVVECSSRLIPLFERSFPGVIFSPIDNAELYAGEIGAHTPLASAGKFLRKREQDFPKLDRGYLQADSLKSAKFRQDITSDSKFAIGLSWRSSNPLLGEMKSASLMDFEALFALSDCRFVDLQYGDTSKEREEVRSKLGIEVSPHPGVDNMNDIEGLAALISACDAVVTTSNTTAHLAGALGKPTWVLLPFGYARIWYWLKRRSDSLWYPRVTLVRQGLNEPWKSVVQRASDDVSRMLRERLPHPLV